MPPFSYYNQIHEIINDLKSRHQHADIIGIQIDLIKCSDFKDATNNDRFNKNKELKNENKMINEINRDTDSYQKTEGLNEERMNDYNLIFAQTQTML